MIYLINHTQLEDILRQQRTTCADNADVEENSSHSGFIRNYSVDKVSILTAPSPSLPETEEVTVYVPCKELFSGSVYWPQGRGWLRPIKVLRVKDVKNVGG